MPEIKKDKQQEKALEEIVRTLEAIPAIRAATDESWAGTLTLHYTIAGKTGRGSNIKVPLGDQDSKEVIAIQKLLRSFMSRLGKEAIAKAEKNRILLDPKELAILSGEEPAPKKTPTAAPMEPVEQLDETVQEEEPSGEPDTEPVLDTGEDMPQQQSNEWGGFEEADSTPAEEDGGFATALQAFQNH